MKRTGLTLAAIGALLLLATPGISEEAQTDEQKMLYTLGFLMSANLVPYDLDAAQLRSVQAGLADGAQRQDPSVSMETFGPRVQAFLTERAAKVAAAQEEAGEAYRQQAAAEEGARTLASELIFKEITAGDGASPGPADGVQVQYRGTLVDGSAFDDSRESPTGGPATFQLNAVIPCFREGIQAMKVGGRAKITCPPSLGYGARGYPPKILGGATLTFDVELIGITGAAPAIPGHPPTP